MGDGLKFIHAADIHLDSPLYGFAAYGDAPVETLRTASRTAFTNLIDHAIDLAVDFMVIAGDLYDGAWRDYNTGYYFCRQMGRLKEANIPVYLLFGNHDAESEMTKKLVLPDTVHVFASNKPTTFRIDHLKVALHGRSFKQAATTDNLAIAYPEPDAGWMNIGVLHTALEGNAMHASYAPCSLVQLIAKGYDYWALGHVHEHAILNQEPWIVFPGNIQGRHIKEAGAKGGVVVTAEDARIQSVERLIVDVLRWHRVQVDATGAKSMNEVILLVGKAIADLGIHDMDIDLHAIRVEITGKCDAHGELFGMEPQLRAEVIGQAEAAGNGKIWVEKIRVQTEPLMDAEGIRARMDAIADLQTYLDQAPHDAALLTELKDYFQLLAGKAPLDVRLAIPDFQRIQEGDITAIIESVRPSLIARLAKGE